MPSQPLSRFIEGPAQSSSAAALQHAADWIKEHWDIHQDKWAPQAGETVGALYSVWLFKGDGSFCCSFDGFADATSLAKSAEKSSTLTKVGIKSNDGPQYLMVWEDTQRVKRPVKTPDSMSVVYTVWLFTNDGSTGFEFEEYSEATAFAKAAEKSRSITKVGVKNNESPQFLTVWEKAKSAAAGR
jgi:hypothetical protein